MSHAPAVDFWTGAHTKHKLIYHLAWISKYRKRVLKGKLAGFLKKFLYQAAEVNKWEIEELSVQVNHVHMLDQIDPDKSVAHVVQNFKGGVSRFLRKEFPELEEFLWGNCFWADGYFAVTVGIAQEEMIKRFIRDQCVG